MTERNPPLTAQQFARLDKAPDTSAAALAWHAPLTYMAVIAHYCDELDTDDAPRGRHIQTAELEGDAL